MNKILVLGGTGLLGAPVARRLQADGFAVRLLARDPDKARTMFHRSFEVVASLERAMASCDGVHISIVGRRNYRPPKTSLPWPPGSR